MHSLDQVEIISGLDAGATISLYKCGSMVDLCLGPHVPSTGLLKVGDRTQLLYSFLTIMKQWQPMLL